MRRPFSAARSYFSKQWKAPVVMRQTGKDALDLKLFWTRSAKVEVKMMQPDDKDFHVFQTKEDSCTRPLSTTDLESYRLAPVLQWYPDKPQLVDISIKNGR